MTFRQWLKLNEEGGGMGNPGTPYPDGLTPSTSKKLGPNKGKLDNSGMSGGPGRRAGGGGGGAPAGGAAPMPQAGNAAPPPK